MTRPCQAIVVTTENESDAPLAGKITPGDIESGQLNEARRYGQGPGRPPSKKQRILAWLADREWDRVTEARAGEISQAFPDCSDDTRRAALLESGVWLTPLIQGVVQDSYQRLQLIRSIVIQAKDHTELAAHNPKTHDLKRAVKLEMALWLRTWLENPPLFPAWVELRRRETSGVPSESE